MPENGADVAHLSQVHGPIMTAGVDLRYTYSKWWSFARHNWRGEWNPHPAPDQRHVGIMNLLHSVQIFSWRFPVLDLRVQAKQVGRSVGGAQPSRHTFSQSYVVQIELRRFCNKRAQ